MKILLLTDVPPCKRFSGALVTYRLCSFMPRGSICCVAVANPVLKAKIDPDLDWIPTEYMVKPEEGYRDVKSGAGKPAASFWAENFVRPMQLRKIADRAAEFGRKQGVTHVWCILEGQTMARLGPMVARRLAAPLLTQVWDPLSWWLRENKVDRFSRKRLLSAFDNAVASSKKCATASWAMSKRYERRYGVATVPVIAGLDKALAKEPVGETINKEEFVVAIAGQLYAPWGYSQEWAALVKALSIMNWRIGSRRIVVKLLGKYMPPYYVIDSPANIIHLGWRSQEETIDILSSADLLYCAYPFGREFRETSRLGFPSKLVTYLAAARPVLVHAPAYASPYRFVKAEECALTCGGLDADLLIAAITKIAGDGREFARLSAKASQTFHKYFTLEAMRKNFAEFLGVEESFLV